MLLPSAWAGLGHVSRCTRLAERLSLADPDLRISLVVSELGLRPLTHDAARSSGFPVRVLPNPSREDRDRVIPEVLGDTDVLIDDTERRLVAYRPLLPRLKAWISMPMLPIWDELFMDWPLLEQVDHVLYTYPDIMPLPSELERFRDKLTVTGPILESPHRMPDRAEARRRLGMAPDAVCLTYAPRGFPFGQDFGERVLGALVGAFARLRRARPSLRLVLTAVPDVEAIQPPDHPPLGSIEGITIEGVITPSRVRDILVAADVAVVEGTSGLFDAAIAGTPVLMVPGPIHETWAEGHWVHDSDAGVIEWIERVTVDSMSDRLTEALDPVRAPQRAARLAQLIGTDGAERAAAAVLDVIDRLVRA